MRILRYGIMSVVLAFTMFTECCVAYANKPEEVIWVNEVFDDYATNSVPETLYTTGGKTKVIEYSPYNKALMLSPGKMQTIVRSNIGKLESRFVFGADIYYSGGELNMTFGLNSSQASQEADDVFLKITNGNVYTNDNKYVGKIERNRLTSIDIALNANYLADIYIDGICKLTKWKSGKKLKSGAMSIVKLSSDQTTMYIDNLRAYSGMKLMKSLPSKIYNNNFDDRVDVGNEFGDFTYFNNHLCYVGAEAKYYNFSAAPKTNEIVTNRLIDHKSENRTDYIYMKQTDTANDCFFDIALNREGWEGDKDRTFSYYLIQGDFKSDSLGSTNEMFMIRDEKSNASQMSAFVYMQPDGSIRFQNGIIASTDIERGKWFNYKMAVNLDKHTVDIYVNGKKVASNIGINENINQINKVRCSIDPGGTPTDLYIDNFTVTGLVNPYEGTENTRTDVFTDESAEREFLQDKEAVSAYGKLMYANGEKSKIEPEPIFDKDKNELYVSTSTIKKLFNCTEELQVAENSVNNILLENKTKTADSGEVYIPVKEVAQKVLGKHVLSMDNGLYIFADREINLDTSGWNYISFRDNPSGRITQLNDIDYLNAFLTFERPNAEKLLQDYSSQSGGYEVHPRLLVTKSGFDELRNLYQTDVGYKKIADSMISTADSYLKAEPETYKFQDSFRTLTTAENFLNKFKYWGYAYQITKDKKWIDRAWKEFEAASKFPDFNTAHIIDTGEYLAGFALGYDWMYEGFSEEQRKFIEDFVYEKGILTLSEGLYGGLTSRPGGALGGVAFKWSSNYNTIVNGGLMMAATAFMEKNPEQCAQILSGSLKSIEYSAFLLMPGGGWVEAFPYWNFAMQFFIYCMGTMDSAFGTSYGIDNCQGVNKTLDYAIACIGTDGINNYHDSGTAVVSDSVYSYDTFSYLSKKFNSTAGAAMRAYTLQKVGGAGLFDALFFNSDIYNHYNEVLNNLDTVQKIDGLELFSVRENYDKENCNLYFSTHFGPTSCYHSHNDTGAFVLDMMGERWADDLGADDYLLQNELGYKATELYRYRTEGHNTFTVNNDAGYSQSDNKFFSIRKYDYNDYSAYMYSDLPYLYKDVPEMKMGYFIGDNKTSVKMRAELTADKDSEIYWFMHTRADIFIDGNNVYLTKNGKNVKVEFLCDDPEAEISEMKAMPLSNSPNPAEQNQNDAYRKIAIRFNAKANTPTSLTVKLSCIGKPSTPITNDSIDTWQLQDKLTEGEDFVDTSFNMTYLGSKIEGALPVYNGEFPEISVVPNDPECIVEIAQAKSIDDKTIIKVWDKNHTVFSLGIIEYFEAVGDNINMFNQIPVENITVSEEPEEVNPKENMIDNSMISRWTCHYDTDWAIFDLGSVQDVDGVAIAHWKGSKRSYYFDIAVSEDGVNFEKVYTDGASPGNSEMLTVYRFDKTCKARYIKYFAKGNNENSASSQYTNILEFKPLKSKF